MAKWSILFAGLSAAVLTASPFGVASAAQPAAHRHPAHLEAQVANKSEQRKVVIGLADDAVGTITTMIPKRPLVTAATIRPGITLRLYEAKRLSPALVKSIAPVIAPHLGVLVIFSISAPSSDSYEAVETSLTSGYSSQVESVSGVYLLDTASLKEYLPYMADPSDDSTCLCTSDYDSFTRINDNNPPAQVYMASVIAAPPVSVKTVSLVSQLATIPGVTLTS